MFDVGFSEIFLLAVVALVVLGPEKLPHAARMAGAWMGRIRRTVISVQAEIEKEVNAQEIREHLKREMERVKQSELAQSLKAEADSLNTAMSDIDTEVKAASATASDALKEATIEAPSASTENNSTAPSTPTVTEAPAPLGEDAFKAHVQSSYQHALTDSDTKPNPAADSGKPAS